MRLGFWLIIASILLCSLSLIGSVVSGDWSWALFMGAIILVDFLILMVIHDRRKTQ